MRVNVALRRLGLFALFGLALGCATRAGFSDGLYDPRGRGRPWLAAKGDIGVEPSSFAVKQALLPSGLRVGFERAPTRGLVGVVLVVGTGSVDDPSGKEGLAHLVEHLSFHGQLGGQKSNEALARWGAVYNADTSLDRTRYYEFAPRAQLSHLLALAGGRLSDPLAGVTASEVVVERRIVENELRERNETGVYGQVVSWMQAALFPADHPYARPVGGTHESLAHIDLTDARAFVKRGYVPARATLMVVGDVDPAEGLAEVLRGLPAALVGKAAHPVAPVIGTNIDRPAFVPPPPPAGASEWQADVLYPEVWLTYFLADPYGPYGPAMRILTDASVQTRLSDALTQDKDISGVEVISLPLRQATVLAVRLSLKRPERRADVAQRAAWELSRLWASRSASGGQIANMVFTGRMPSPGPGRHWRDSENWRDTRRLAVAHAISSEEAFASRAPQRAELFHMTGGIDALDRLVAAVAVQPSDALSDHAASLLAPDRARVLFLMPGGAPRPPTPALAGGAPPEPGSSAASLALPFAGQDFGPAPPVAPVTEVLQAEEYRLANGLEVKLLPGGVFPSVTVALGFRGGAAASPPGPVELLGALESDDLFVLSDNALNTERVSQKDFAGNVVQTGARNLQSALYLLGERLSVLDNLAWNRILARLRPELESRELESPKMQAISALWRALYGAHPYGRHLPLPALAQVTPRQMTRALADLYHPANATLVIAGNFDRREARALVDVWFSQWRGADDRRPLEVAPVPPPQRGSSPREELSVVARPGATQVELTLACRLPPAPNVKAFTTGQLLVRTLAGRLNRTLRDDGGMSYGVAGDSEVLRGGAHHLLIRAAIDNAHFAPAWKLVREQWSHFVAEGLDRGTVSQARWALVERASLRFQTARELAIGALEAASEGWSLSEVARWPDQLNDISTGELAAAFATCRANTVISLLGDEEVIGRGVGASP